MTSGITSTRPASLYSNPSSTGIMEEVSTLQTALARCDWPGAQATSIRLVNLGRGVIAKQIKQDRSFDPIPMTLRLVEALNSPDIQWQEEVKYHIARATRLFMELACMKAVLDNKKVYRDTQETLRTSLDRLVDYSKDKPTLLYELKCTSEALKLMEETDTKGYLIALFSAASDPSISSVITLIGLLPGLIAKKSKDWFSEALFLSWMGPSARESKDLFVSLRETLKTNLDTLEMAQTGVEFLADIVWNGTPQLQREALRGEIGLITLLNKQRPSRTLRNLIPTMWPVRYRTVQILSTLTDHTDTLIVQEATKALLDRRLQENNSTVKELLATLEQNPTLREQWKQQFEQEKSQVIEANLREQEDVAAQEVRLTQLEQQLAQSIRSQRLTAAEITLQKQALEQERQYVRELRAESEAHKENVESMQRLIKQIHKGVNEALDAALARPAVPAIQSGHPSHLCCPLSLDLMIDPVSDPEGNTYEKSYIVNWLKMHGTSPITRTPTNVNSLAPNRAIQQALEEYRKQDKGSPVASLSSTPAPGVKDGYTDLLFQLIEHEAIKSIPTLLALLEGQAEELMSQKGPLTVQQEERYAWVQKLLVNDKVSSLASKKLHQLHGQALPPSSSTTPVSSPMVEQKTLPVVSNPVSSAAKAAAPAPIAQPSPYRNVEFVQNTSKGTIRGEVRFGAAEWKKYFGDVGAEPPLPANVAQIDNAPCPFSNDPLIKVKDTHMWVLIPAKVNGTPLTLNTLQKLIQNPQRGGHKTDYNYYHDGVKQEHGDKAPRASYWALMTRDVIPGSRNKNYADQKALVAGYAGYTLPSALAAVVCLSMEHVTSGTCLYPHAPFTFTRCTEVFEGKWPIGVGAFGPAGFYVNYPYSHRFDGAHDNTGAAAYREFVETSVPIPQPSPNRNVEFVTNTSKGIIRGEVRFGAAEWKKYFGDVGAEPPLPANVAQIDNAPCPFSNDPLIKVKDTHMWVLIPAKVNGIPLTLNTLQKLIQNPLGGGHKTDYALYFGVVKKEQGDKPPEASYWALMTRDVIPGSSDMRYDDQKKLVGRAGYTLPEALAVAVCLSAEYVISGTTLYPDESFTWTRCIETNKGGATPLAVGDFLLPRGFSISFSNCNDFDVDNHGVAAFQKFVDTSAPILHFSPNRDWAFVTNTSKGIIRGEVRFGAADWKKYFGDVGVEPPLPANVAQIDNAPCPFSNDPLIKVKDTHMWVLIPAKVNGIPLTLNTLQKLIQNPLGGGPKTNYEYYSHSIKEEHGDKAPRASYWALMTRDVIPGSQDKKYVDRKVFVAGYAGYTLPRALAAAVCLSVEHVTSGTYLYPENPSWTYTKCAELIDNKHHMDVGVFGPAGFYVFNSDLDPAYGYSGAAAYREFIETSAPIPQPSPNRNVEFVERTSKGTIRGEVRFGAAEWKKYFGDVGAEPPLPANVAQIDNAPCPFSNDPLIKVKDTHMWVLIPAKVNGIPLTLNTLQKLIQNPLGGGLKTDYHYFASDVKEEHGDKAPRVSYWALMTRDVIPGSSNMHYEDQKKLVSPAGYTLPPALVAAVCLSVEHVASGTRLYPEDPMTYMRCTEVVKNRSTMIIGAFSSAGFDVYSDYFGAVNDIYCVAAFREFS